MRKRYVLLMLPFAKDALAPSGGAIRPLRVLHVISGIAPRYGGPSTVIGPLCAGLNRLPGVTAEVATTDADGPGKRLDATSGLPGVVTHMFRRNCSERWKFSASLWRWLRRHAADYDLLHIHGVWSFATAAAAAAGRRARIPYIVRPAGMFSAYSWGRGRWKKRLYWSLIEGRAVRNAAAFHATSPEEADEIKAVWPMARTFVVPHGVDDAAWRVPCAPDVLRRRCGPSVGDRPILLFLSRLHPKKGLTDFLLPAIARLGTTAFLAVAGGPDDRALGYEQEVRQTVARLGLGNRVALLGPVSPAERWAFFDGAAVLVLPSHSENFGIVVAEAMARGCPVVVSEMVHAAAHVTAAAAGRVVPLAVGPLATALDELLADSPLRTRLGDAGRQYAAAHLTWDRIAGQIHAMYQSCVAPSGGISFQGTTESV